MNSVAPPPRLPFPDGSTEKTIHGHGYLSSLDTWFVKNVLPATPTVAWAAHLFAAAGGLTSSVLVLLCRRYGVQAVGMALAGFALQVGLTDKTYQLGDAFMGHAGVKRLMDVGYYLPLALNPYKAFLHLSWPEPHRIVLTSDLERYRNPGAPERAPQFIFGSHPHGILQFCNCCMMAEGGRRLAESGLLGEGFEARQVVANALLRLPLAREYVCGFQGSGSASVSSLNYQLGRGRSVCIAIGGALESMFTSFAIPRRGQGSTPLPQGSRRQEAESRVDRMRLVLEDRKGFVRIGVLAGVPLVPVIGFGENALFTQVVLSRTARQRQLELQRMLGFAVPLFYGASPWLPVVPRGDVPLASVVGPPVDPTLRRRELRAAAAASGVEMEFVGAAAEDGEAFLTPAEVRGLPRAVLDVLVDIVHARYVAAVRALHSAYAARYGSPCDQTLEIISSKEARDPAYMQRIVESARLLVEGAAAEAGPAAEARSRL